MERHRAVESEAELSERQQLVGDVQAILPGNSFSDVEAILPPDPERINVTYFDKDGKCSGVAAVKAPVPGNSRVFIRAGERHSVDPSASGLPHYQILKVDIMSIRGSGGAEDFDLVN